MTTQEAYLVREAGRYLRLQFSCEFGNEECKNLAEVYFSELVTALEAGKPSPPLPSPLPSRLRLEKGYG